MQVILKLLNILREPLFIRALLKGTAAGVEHRRLLQSINCRHVVDIGANRGQFALIARNFFPNARIDSFEPLAEPADIYRRVFAKDTKTHLHNCAIGAKKCTMKIHVSERDDSSSLLPIGLTQSKLFPHTGEKEIRETQVLPLHEALGMQELLSPALLKIDVQGFELEVLKGCGSILDSFTWVYVECSFIELYKGQALIDEVLRYLLDRGFYLAGIYNVSYSKEGLAIQADFFFRRMA